MDDIGDFGAIVYFSRKDGKPFNDEAFENISRECNEYAVVCKLESALCESFLFRVGKSMNSEGLVDNITVILTEQNGDQPAKDWHAHVDAKNVITVADELAPRFPDYTLRPSFEWWDDPWR